MQFVIYRSLVFINVSVLHNKICLVWKVSLSSIHDIPGDHKKWSIHTTLLTACCAMFVLHYVCIMLSSQQKSQIARWQETQIKSSWRTVLYFFVHNQQKWIDKLCHFLCVSTKSNTRDTIKGVNLGLYFLMFIQGVDLIVSES